MKPSQLPSKIIVIIGAGPAGSALACLLAQRGIQCILFDDNKRPSLLVGESLVPATIPLLRRLGVEEQIATIATLKPGACFRHSNGYRVDIQFKNGGRQTPNYAYNVPRPQFDDIIKRRAAELGATVIHRRAKLYIDDNNKVLLDSTSLEHADLEQQPDLVIDATGRNRVFSKLMNLPTQRGTRDDVAYFAHFRHFDTDTNIDGQIVITVLKEGWSWQIPLQDRLSVGVVLNSAAAKKRPGTPAERLDQLIDENELLQKAGRNRERISPVMAYANYPIISESAAGANWALIGDAMGFTDPMLSPGVFMSLKSAERFDHVLATQGFNQQSMFNYCREMKDWYQSWAKLIDYFYDGQLLALSHQGEALAKKKPRVSVHALFTKLTKQAVAAMVSGAATRSKFNQQLFSGACRRVLKGSHTTKDFKVN